ncbi:MAG: hypothetical protein MI922_18045 [Bacteroidales bacterium]|nr:hypothetical protein [Bacteroidales bacterium]
MILICNINIRFRFVYTTLIITLTAFITNDLYSKNPPSNDKAEVLYIDHLHYFGVNYSHITMLGYQAEDSLRYKRKIQKGISKFHKHINAKDLRKWLHKQEITSYNLMHESFRFKSWHNHDSTSPFFALNNSDLQFILEPYPKTGKGGVGFVIVIDNINNKNDLVNCWYIFFDMSTKAMLWKQQLSSHFNAFSATRIMNGLVNTTKNFVDAYYVPISNGDRRM